MEDQVPFKVYTYWSETEKPEVRRFGIEKSVVSSYHYLNAKIQDIFPRLKGKAYSIAWKDEDGDDVLISSDDEVMTALATMTGDLIKLYVYIKGGDSTTKCDIVITAVPAPEPSTSTGKAVHYGVMCDHCNSTIVGFRYKCTSCDDFDLCSRCEANGLHPEHCMMRVPVPNLSRTVIKAAIKRSRHLFKTVASAVADECPSKKHRRDKSGERKHHGHHRSHHSSEHGTRHSDHHGRRHTRTSWLDIFSTYMNEFANLAGDVADEKPGEPKPQEQATSSTGNAEVPKTSTQNAEAPKTSTDNAEVPKMSAENGEVPKTSTENAETPRPNLSNMGFPESLLTEAMKCEGIDKLLTYIGEHLNDYVSSMQHMQQQQQASETANDVEMGQTDAKTSDASFVSVKSEISTQASASSDHSDRDVSPEKGDDWTMINKDKEFMEGNATAEPVLPIGFNLPEEFRDRMKISEGQNLYPPLNMSTAVLNPKEAEHISPQESQAATAPSQAAPAPAQAASAPAQAASAPPQAASAPPQAAKPPQQAATDPPQPGVTQAQPTQRKPHPKPHVEAALQRMFAMGFTDRDGWLTQLLELEDGNIAAVLDLVK